MAHTATIDSIEAAAKFAAELVRQGIAFTMIETNLGTFRFNMTGF